MKSISYKFKLLFIYLISLSAISILVYNLLTSFSSTNVGTISKENFKSKSLEREEYLHDFFYPYIITIKAIDQSDLLKEYFDEKLQKDTIENYFLDLKRSMPCLTQVRLLDIDGVEEIKIDGKPIGLVGENAPSIIVPDELLQDKSSEDYVKKFLSLKKGEVGLSKMELNTEFGKIVLPKQPTLRLGMTVYDKLGKKKGILVFNLCLRTFFKKINKTILYYVHIIDNEGRFINHINPEYGLLGNDHEYSIYDELPEHAKGILQNKEYFGGNLFSYKFNTLDNGQNLKLILQIKYDKELQAVEKTQSNFIVFSILFAIAFLLISLYFAKLPDLLQRKAQQERLQSKLTKRPNRLALMEDLSLNRFEHSIVILLSINNILKIQNTYGYEISNKLLVQFSNFLVEYGQGIEKVYMNSYTVFGLKYHYEDENRLKDFLNNFINHIEHHPFTINIEGNDVEFLLEITLGASDPHSLNNNIDELHEAENALEYAIEHKHQADIFSSSFQESIEKNKENILLARKIKKAIENNGVFLHFQPILNNTTEKVEKYESLIRMRCDKGEMIFPDKFLPIAKQINKYNTLSYIVIDKSFQYFQDKEYEFSINISILDIENPEFREFLFERLQHYNIADKLVLEIVEQEGVDNFDEFFEFIKNIKEHGCKIAIDDFGSGYSNYEHIINASDYIDYLKIDGSLIKNLPTNTKTQILVGSLKFLCDNLQIQTIAEYVEDEEVLKYVQSIGIDYSQGYHIGKPAESLVDEK